MKQPKRFPYFRIFSENLFTVLLSSFIFFNSMVSAHVGIPSSPTTACVSIDSTDLGTHVANQIDSRIALAASSTGISLYTSRPTTSTSSAWVRNPEVWSDKVIPLDFTGVSGWDDQSWYLPYLQGGTLISPRHFVTAAHFYPPLGSTLVFFDASGNAVPRVITAYSQVPSTDIEVGLLDSDVPDSITYYPIMASTTLRNMLQRVDSISPATPVARFDQESKILVQQLFTVANPTSIGIAGVSSALRVPFAEATVEGDSGRPTFMIVDNQPVLIATQSGYTSGAHYGAYINEINTAMASLGGGYQVTQYLPTCFTEYEFNTTPYVSNNYNPLITYESVSSATPIYTYTASDVDSSQTHSFSIVSLVNLTASTTLNPSDYFSLNSSTGQLYQINDMDIDEVGSILRLTVKVEDNGQTPASSTRQTTIDLREVLNRNNKIILDPNFDSSSTLTPLDFVFDENDGLIFTGSFDNGSFEGVGKVNSAGTPDQSFISAIGDGLIWHYADNLGVGKEVLFDAFGNLFFTTFFDAVFDNTPVGIFAKLNPQGELDTAFVQGMGAGTIDSESAQVYKSITIGGRLLSGGVIPSFDGVTTANVVLINADGTLNTTFTNNFGKGFGANSAVFPQLSDSFGRIYISGDFTSYVDANNSTTTVPYVARFSSTGVFDSSFNSSLGTGFNDAVYSIVERSDGKLLIGGRFTSYKGVSTGRIALIDTNGNLDEDFNTNVGSGFGGYVTLLKLSPEGKIYVGGGFESFNGTTTNNFVRLNADGTLDTEFMEALGNGINGSLSDIEIRSDGAVGLLGGFDFNGEFSNGAIQILVTETPSTPSVPDLLGSYDSGDSSVDNVTYERTVVFSGTGSSTASVSLRDNGTHIATGTVASNGVWFATTTLSLGTHNISAVQTLTLITTESSAASNALSVTVAEAPAAPVQSSGGGGPSGGGSGGGATFIYSNNQNQAIPAKVTPSANKLPSNNSNSVVSNSVPKGIVNSFSRNLTSGSKGEDVKNLQKFLNGQGFTISKTGAGSKGKESTVFGPKTKQALAKFQKAKGIKPSSGNFGPLTRAYIQKNYSIAGKK